MDDNRKSHQLTPSSGLKALLFLVVAIILVPILDKYGATRITRWQNRDYGAFLSDYTAVMEYLDTGNGVRWYYPVYSEADELISLQTESSKIVSIDDKKHFFTPIIKPGYHLLTSIRIASDRVTFSYGSGRINIVYMADDAFPDYLMQPDEPFTFRTSRIAPHWFRMDPSGAKEE